MGANNFNYIRRMLFSYLPILFVTVSALIFIFISVINEIYVRNAIQANRLTAAYITNMVDSSLKGISFDAQKMLEADDDIRQYLDGPSDRARNYDVSNKLSNLMVRYGLIDSIYLYRAKDSMVLDQSALRPIDRFPDRAYIRSSLEKMVAGVWTSSRMKEMDGLDTSEAVNVSSLGLKIPRDSGSLGYLIINIRVSAMESFIGQMIDGKVTEARLFDAKGKPFFGNPDEGPSSNRLGANTVSDYTGWNYKISIKGAKLLDVLFRGNKLWLALGIVSILFAISSTFYVTRRSYKPIEAILHRIDRFSSVVKPGEQKKKKNEFAFIDQAIERLITNNMVFQEKQQENQVIRRQQFLQILLKGEYEDDRDMWEQEWQHFGLSAGHYIVGLLELDQYVQFGLKYSPNDQSLFKFIISSVAVEVAEQNGRKLVAEWISKNKLVLLLISDEGKELDHAMLEVSEQIRDWVEKHLEFTVTIGIGSAEHNETAIAKSFGNAEEAISRKVTLGANQIIEMVEVKGRSDGEWLAYLEIIRTILRKLRAADPEWLNEHKSLFNEMAVHHLRKDDVERLLHYFVFQMEYELEGAIPDDSGSWINDAKPLLLLALKESDTLPELEQIFTASLERLDGQIREAAQYRRHHALMREIRDYVSEHYMDPNLSLTMLSDRFQINAKYLSQLFKESIGQNFSDFLIGLRMEYAKKMLLESEVSVQEISEALGYANTTSFIRIFKKIVGMSPGQYRESIK